LAEGIKYIPVRTQVETFPKEGEAPFYILPILPYGELGPGMSFSLSQTFIKYLWMLCNF
jgi:hypothetical protein